MHRESQGYSSGYRAFLCKKTSASFDNSEGSRRRAADGPSGEIAGTFNRMQPIHEATLDCKSQRHELASKTHYIAMCFIFFFTMSEGNAPNSSRRHIVSIASLNSRNSFIPRCTGNFFLRNGQLKYRHVASCGIHRTIGYLSRRGELRWRCRSARHRTPIQLPTEENNRSTAIGGTGFDGDLQGRVQSPQSHRAKRRRHQQPDHRLPT